MSEKLHDNSHESAPKLEQHEAREKMHELGEKLQENAEKAHKGEKSKSIEKERTSAEKLAISGKEAAPKGEQKQQRQVHRSEKKQTYRATMNRVEARLPAYQRTFSRVVNNETVDKVSNVASKTIARPSALLGGSVVAFLALLIITYFASHYGWEVSGSEFIVFVAAGWALGLAAEGVLKLVRR